MNINIENMLEAGCADSLLSVFLCKIYNIKNIYLFDYDIVRGITPNLRKMGQFFINKI